ncbi:MULTISPECIES: immunoglobulin-like domain-containing protein [unclassified Clostridium]|uniref:immunoglobulin-like domain-containing protein n=1 Tax=unclassified Clostridium TaxID=2614128 RepID=UPI000297C450|nr:MULTISPECIES: immunoglobulin-like domain-containing protein [unclassified Clostridium]EKQ53407.1 MAG: putative cell wall binding protein [Clostridium sp. Maddingley MBC34-26]
MNQKAIALIMSTMIVASAMPLLKVNAEYNNGWVNADNGWNYYENGTKKTGWINVDNNWYYLNESGSMVIGWQKIDGNWYFMQDSGAMKTGWLKDNAAWYYLNDNGQMALNTTIDGYYLGVNGAMIEKNSNNDSNGDKLKFKDVIMKTEKSTYELGTKEIKIYITNDSKESIYYGLQYEVEKFENDKWTKVPFKEEPIFAEIAYNLEPGQTNSQIISMDKLENLTSGRYRIVKLGGKLTAEFELK